MIDTLILIAIYTFLIGFFIFQFWIERRMKREHQMMIKVINQVHILSFEDAEKKLSWKWRWEALAKMTKKRVIFSRKEIKPENYWDDLKFLEPTITVTHSSVN